MCPAITNISTFFGCGTYLIGKLIPIIFILAIVLFIWGVVKYFIIDVDEEAKRAQGKQFILWALIALVVISCVWGLVRLFGSTVGLHDYTRVLPGVQPSNYPIDFGEKGASSGSTTTTGGSTNGNAGGTIGPGGSTTCDDDPYTEIPDCL